MTTPTNLAAAYYLAAQWHDKQAAGCEAMARDEPRLGPDIRARAAENAKHHRGSAAGLRLAATWLGRAADEFMAVAQRNADEAVRAGLRQVPGFRVVEEKRAA